MNQDELESALLSSIKSHEDVMYCKREGISRISFVTSEPVGLGDVWEYVEEHTRSHSGELPDDKDLETLHGFKRGKHGDLKSYVKLVRDNELRRRAKGLVIDANAPGLTGGATPLEEKPRETITGLARELSDLQAGVGKQYSFLDRDAMDRLTDFDAAKKEIEEHGTIGIKTGLRAFDEAQLGWTQGEMIVVLGSTGVGKSWLLTYIAATAYEIGKRILIISPELTVKEQGFRFDACLANVRDQDIELSNHKLVTGQEDRTLYKGWLEGMTSRTDIAVKDSSEPGQKALSYNDCWTAALEFKPDILMIDGLHLLDSDVKNKQGWESLKDGVRDLKALAQQQKIVVIAAHQAERTSSRKDDRYNPPGLHQIAYGFAVGQSADRVISMSWYSRDRPMRRKYAVPKLRTGKEILGNRTLGWNVDIGGISEINDEGLESFGEGEKPPY